jgi:nicotinamidase/pyrazinamidase
VILLGGFEQVLWPVHCVQHTRGAEISRVLDPERITRVFPKGMDPDVDSYSGFFDNGRIHATGLDDWLKERGASELYVAGLATDYCVRATALDARKLGWMTSVVEDACRGVELRPGDAARALDELRRSGVRIIDVATAVDEASR